jgi:hypothetical protein
MRGRHTLKSLRAMMRRAAARRRLAVLLRRKPFGRAGRAAIPDIDFEAETGGAARRPFPWRKGGVQ